MLYRANQPREGSDAQAFQYGLTEALGRADGWVLSNAEVAEMESFTVGEQKGNVRSWRYTEPVNVSVNIGMHSEFHATVQQYVTPSMDALARKMGQYPAGTRFLMTLDGTAERLESVRDAVRSMVREHGFAVEFAADNSF